MLRNGTVAPDFQLPDTGGNHHSLAELRRNGPLLLLFFRFTGCPTSRRDLMSYAEAYDRIRSLGGHAVAISADSIENHASMSKGLGLPFTILSDDGFRISEQYGVYESEDGEGPKRHGEPAIIIVDVDGNIAFSQTMSGPKGLASAAEMSLILLYMAQNGGRY